ncbi:hypothetical protein FHS79_000857 [Polymorphobacter multimanifer]|uniref:Flagella basal body P-ring formation protein FlgA C-terminal domain-containing protein n=1 Tax=Polymorphobacter multimanifer TaxID=1070431 RepID=A0A841L1J7_9SPHN|nr:hypothetical protein [Polymorphobacter multimanifer]MBB6226699.1 hypothetical protein [Polymorphobacter multimanifer]
MYVLVGLMMAAAAPTMANADLLAAAERFAGRALLVDDRLQLPACAAPGFAWAGPLVEARCAAPAWRVFLPPQGESAAPGMVYAPAAPGTVYSPAAPGMVYAPASRGVDGAPRYRRGERVVVTLAGAGFDVRLEAIAEGDEHDGRLWVRPLGGNGRRLRVRVDEDGRTAIDGLNGLVSGR